MKLRPSHQKLRGGYYTPKPIADFITRWAITSSTAKVLEPSCGDGNILVSAAETLLDLGARYQDVANQLYGVEFDPEEAREAVSRLCALKVPIAPPNVFVGDFFAHCYEKLLGSSLLGVSLSQKREFDVVVGNPPFIRYQNFPEEHRTLAFQLMERCSLRPNRLTNAWLPFLAVSTLLLNERGKLGMVIPAELFQVNYAAGMRKFLSDYFQSLTLVTFKKLVFNDIQQEVVLLLGERSGAEQEGIRTVELENAECLKDFDPKSLSAISIKPMDHSTEKWTQYFLEQNDIHLLRSLREDPRLTSSGEAIDVDVGVVTGNNDYFILNQQTQKQWSLEDDVERIVTRSAHLGGAVFGEKDWLANADKGLPVALFLPQAKSLDFLPVNVQQYIEEGVKEKQNTGYKCRIRKLWYLVPSIWIPDAFMLRQVHSYPKLVINEAAATCTDTLHRVRFNEGFEGKRVAAAFLNSVTFAFSEVKGRSYGGGVLTFEPSEAEDLPLPLLNSEKLDLDEIDKLVRQNEIDAVLDITDQVLLVEGLGMSVEDVRRVRAIWKQLRNRRFNRKLK